MRNKGPAIGCRIPSARGRSKNRFPVQFRAAPSGKSGGDPVFSFIRFDSEVFFLHGVSWGLYVHSCIADRSGLPGRPRHARRPATIERERGRAQPASAIRV